MLDIWFATMPIWSGLWTIVRITVVPKLLLQEPRVTSAPWFWCLIVVGILIGVTIVGCLFAIERRMRGDWRRWLLMLTVFLLPQIMCTIAYFRFLRKKRVE